MVSSVVLSLLLVLPAPAAAGATRSSSRAETLAMQRAYTEAERRCERTPSMVKVLPGQCPSSAPVPPQGLPDGSGWLATPSHCLGCSS